MTTGETDSTFNFNLEETSVLDTIHLTETNSLSEAAWSPDSIPSRLTFEGIEGTPLPYSTRTDEALSMSLFVALLLGLTIIGSSWRYLTTAASDFFYPRDHANIYEEHTPDSQLQGGFILWLLATLSLSSIVYLFMPEHTLLSYAIALGGSAINWTARVVAYFLINFTFFETHPRHTWRKGYRLLLLLESILLWLIALVATLHGMSTQTMLILTLLAVGVVKTLFIIKTASTFFKGATNPLHIILYFCTIEITPSLILYLLVA